MGGKGPRSALPELSRSEVTDAELGCQRGATRGSGDAAQRSPRAGSPAHRAPQTRPAAPHTTGGAALMSVPPRNFRRRAAPGALRARWRHSSRRTEELCSPLGSTWARRGPLLLPPLRPLRAAAPGRSFVLPRPRGAASPRTPSRRPREGSTGAVRRSRPPGRGGSGRAPSGGAAPGQRRGAAGTELAARRHLPGAAASSGAVTTMERGFRFPRPAEGRQGRAGQGTAWLSGRRATCPRGRGAAPAGAARGRCSAAFRCGRKWGASSVAARLREHCGKGPPVSPEGGRGGGRRNTWLGAWWRAGAPPAGGAAWGLWAAVTSSERDACGAELLRAEYIHICVYVYMYVYIYLIKVALSSSFDLGQWGIQYDQSKVCTSVCPLATLLVAVITDRISIKDYLRRAWVKKQQPVGTVCKRSYRMKGKVCFH